MTAGAGQADDDRRGAAAARLALLLAVARSRYRRTPASAANSRPSSPRRTRWRRLAAQVRKYDAPIARQREQLSTARAAVRAGRLRLFAVRRRRQRNAARSTPRSSTWSAISRRCSASALQLAGGGSDAVARADLASLDANGCRDDAVAERRLPRARSTATRACSTGFRRRLQTRNQLEDCWRARADQR